MSEEDDFDMLLDDGDLLAASLQQHTGRLGGGTVENKEGANGSDGGDSKDGGAREWTAEEVKLVEPCIKLIEVTYNNYCLVYQFSCHSIAKHIFFVTVMKLGQRPKIIL